MDRGPFTDLILSLGSWTDTTDGTISKANLRIPKELLTDPVVGSTFTGEIVSIERRVVEG